jgi:hypothetical protein
MTKRKVLPAIAGIMMAIVGILLGLVLGQHGMKASFVCGMLGGMAGMTYYLVRTRP